MQTSSSGGQGRKSTRGGNISEQPSYLFTKIRCGYENARPTEETEFSLLKNQLQGHTSFHSSVFVIKHCHGMNCLKHILATWLTVPYYRLQSLIFRKTKYSDYMPLDERLKSNTGWTKHKIVHGKLKTRLTGLQLGQPSCSRPF